jgi:hypothetical protein
VIDATCPWRIAEELRNRGYVDATSAKELGARDALDPELFKVLSALNEPVVLVTYDNKMPLEHIDEVRRHKMTLAIIDKDARPHDLTEEQYWREVIHRHAHKFVAQPPGSVWKYRCTNRRTKVKV